MARVRDNFALAVVVAAKGSGAYVADAHLRIRDERQRVVFDRLLGGPWLLIDLPLGRFTVEASYRGELQSRATTIHPGDHHMLVFHFEQHEP